MIRGYPLLAVLGALLLVWGGWMDTKAWLAQQLIARSWSTGIEGEKPWPWADITAVARLSIGDENWIILRGTSGEALAFGPGWLEGSAYPGESGVSVISAHRDTHFASLRNLQRGDPIELVTAHRERKRYQVSEVRIVDSYQQRIRLDGVLDGASQLVLTTCYPFDAAVPGGPLRWVVIADQVAPAKP